MCTGVPSVSITLSNDDIRLKIVIDHKVGSY